MLAIGMSATLGDPAEAWRRLVGRDEVFLLAPAANERTSNPRGREYFYFIQPEVESRGQDIAGASTTIQSLMCLRSEEHTSELQSLMRISYAVFCLKKKIQIISKCKI